MIGATSPYGAEGASDCRIAGKTRERGAYVLLDPPRPAQRVTSRAIVIGVTIRLEVDSQSIVFFSTQRTWNVLMLARAYRAAVPLTAPAE